MITLPLYIFFTLPPQEITTAVPHEHVVEVANVTTHQVTTIRNVSLNVTEGTSVFLTKQAPPPLIDSDIVIALDTSGSMTGNRLTTAKEAIINLITALNQSEHTLHTKDRIGLVSFSGSRGDNNWSNDAVYQAGLGLVGNETHLNNLISKTNALTAGGSTDIWAGLNFSLQLLENNPRNTSSLKSIILLTDGRDECGPFWQQVYTYYNYTGFLSLNSNYSTSSRYNDIQPYSKNPVAFARANGIKINTIGIYDNTGYGIDPNFLMNISRNTSFGTYGENFEGNDNLTITESFLKARDSASGWVQLASKDVNITNSGSNQLYTYNITEKQRRLKWDVNWENKSILVNSTLITPNGTIINLKEILPNNFDLISPHNPLSVIIDFPDTGLWKFNITWANVNSTEQILSRLSSYQPPVYINDVIQENSTNLNGNKKTNFITFDMNVTNKNSLFSFHNITPSLLGNFSDYNISYTWTPSIVPEIPYNSSTSFQLNITFNEGVQIKGTFLLLVNCSEGYYDAYAQPLSLDARTIITNSTVETLIGSQTVTSTIVSTSIGYNYNRQVVNQLNWAGLIVTFSLIFFITLLYIRSKEESLRKLASQLRPSFLRSKKSIVSGLANIGIDTSNLSMDQLLSEISHLDDLGSAIGSQTGTVLSTEDLIKVASGVTTDRIAKRLSNKTGESLNDILDLIANASSIDEISQKLNLSYDEFMFIITPDEQVEKFQNFIKSLVTPLGAPASSRMFITDNINFNDFRNTIKQSIR